MIALSTDHWASLVWQKRKRISLGYLTFFLCLAFNRLSILRRFQRLATAHVVVCNYLSYRSSVGLQHVLFLESPNRLWFFPASFLHGWSWLSTPGFQVLTRSLRFYLFVSNAHVFFKHALCEQCAQAARDKYHHKAVRQAPKS